MDDAWMAKYAKDAEVKAGKAGIEIDADDWQALDRALDRMG